MVVEVVEVVMIVVVLGEDQVTVEAVMVALAEVDPL
jgi:hypothetical protein